MSEEYLHRPVMATEVVEILRAVPPGLVVDATVGGGGHARLLLEARSDLRLLGLDRDPWAVAAARRTLAPYGERAVVLRSAFGRLGEVLMEAGHEGAVAILFDLGVSSPQLDVGERGFSYRHEGPLDMRMDPSQERTAADIVNRASEEELVRILRAFGEERHARRIARRIVARRPLRTTTELASVVAEALPAAARRRPGHPARRTFQALRIAVNDELAQLEAGLDAAVAALVPGGRLVVISYHSLEDRIVKERFGAWATGGLHPPGIPVRETTRGGVVRLLTRRPLRPREEEVAVNPRAQSARLRALERRVEEAA